jgi:glycosyltransferase involved in cell wall biosynthesis
VGRDRHGLRVLLLNWRDTTHPEGGGSEIFAEHVAAGLVARGHEVTIFCAAHPGAPRDELRPDGVRIMRAGGRFTVYPSAALKFHARQLGRVDVVVDVQNGLPFLARVWSRRPVVVLVHHVHREQWHFVLGKRAAQFGWWIESKLAPRLQRGLPYVAVSRVTRDELVELGVRQEDIHIVHNGTSPPPEQSVARAEAPHLVVLGRLVPHKRVEIALLTLAELRAEWPNLRMSVVGQGWWHDELVRESRRLGLGQHVCFEGFVDEATKHQILGRSWVALMPSVKEGWGQSVMEAAMHGTPSVAFRQAGGLAESIQDGRTGLLVDDERQFVDAVRTLLAAPRLRAELGDAARKRAREFSWDNAVENLESVLTSAVELQPGVRRLSASRTAPAGSSPGSSSTMTRWR